MKAILRRGLSETGSLWPQVRVAYGWVHRAAQILKNDQALPGSRLRLRGLVGAMARHRAKAGELEPAIDHFLKVSRSYWSGLFHCYDVPGLPRTNNDLEHLFGANRYHERRATGRKVASPALVLRGSVRVVASTATRMQGFSGHEIAPAKVESWRALRRGLGERRQQRVLRHRFRRDPASYLAKLEAELDQLTLLP